MRFISLFFALQACVFFGFSQTKYWVSSTQGNWSDAANWSFTSGGTGGAGVPQTGEDVVFDNAGSGICDLNGMTYTIATIRFNKSATFPSIINNGQINIQGDIYLDNGAQQGTVILSLQSVGNQHLYGNLSATNYLSGIEIDKTSGIVFIHGNVGLRDYWNLVNGTVDDFSDNTAQLTMGVPTNVGINFSITGTQSFTDVVFKGANTFINPGDIITINEKITFLNSTITIDGGELHIQGDVDITAGNQQGTTVVRFLGSGDQHIY